MKFIIEGNPIPKLRARTFMRGKRVVTWDSQAKEKDHVKKKLMTQMRQAFDSENKEIVMEASNLAYGQSYFVSLSFYLPIPKTLNLGQKNAILWHRKHDKKPDVDNLCKWVLDCANEILYPDDAKIIELISKKYYSENPRTEIDIMPIKQLKFSEPIESVLKLISPNQMKDLIHDFQEIAKFSPECLDETEGPVFEECFSSYCKSLIKFCNKHGDLIKKIKTKSSAKEKSEC